MPAYYNEIDPYAAQWLRNLIAAGHIAPGDVDERSIKDVKADDLRGYEQAHFFAGIGGWSIALRLAGWPDARPVWTGSCPCQPFSAAGAGKAADDERHLWPAWLPLITERRPPIVFGEQVEAAIGWGWLDAVFADLESQGYACGASVLPACSVGAPHIRQRCWFVADAGCDGREGAPVPIRPGRQDEATAEQRGIGDGRVADADGRDASTEGLQRSGEHGQQPEDGGVVRMADASEGRRGARVGHICAPAGQPDIGGRREDGILADTASGGFGELGDASQPRRGRHSDGGFWTCEWLPCTDGKARPVRPGSFPLAHGVQRRPSKLRAYGNAIVPQVAAEFIIAADEAIRETRP